MASSYLPALRFRSLTRFYDPLIAATTRERSFRRRAIAIGAPVAGERVLDVGCGTGSLALLLAREAKGCQVAGIDADPAMLAQARRKASCQGVDVDWREGRAEALPFADGSVDLAFSTLFFHHLLPQDKSAAAAEILRVLRPGGRLVVADWGAPGGPLMWLASRSVRVFDGASTADSLAGRLPAVLAASGFVDVAERGTLRTLFGRLVLHSARRSGQARGALDAGSYAT